ncbi:UDP-3-O-(3-hydroxymyristoyl)glucosamine N-acyltransferase [Gimesia maris]|uniref:UDP-3-O-(3-hydroxymyristoyl)glucosamine N-acyltransferase n=1 Tax=Gimesia maris TaxID=122 RepID=UPI000E8A00EC|nr:UDP-3-O-(3-hydroxymyristoyl)glucosamine N-acyltransferase [Gimesia maris]QDU13394.1 UDP-3-O-acylglucosamine N-acyltransferase [Gimesia maris]HAW31278.1 UDP-3-O-(3-hydroxymyristoyl)glucosamine N-acyltransferase [Planctomycetaceae bacterium]|tara:strand:- start:23796 stop:24878 length:1083 start_codon:yes stop_codon:yes gene_type:complete
MSTTVEWIAQELNCLVKGNQRLEIHGAESVLKAGPHDITFVGDELNLKRLKSSNAGAVLLEKRLEESFEKSFGEAPFTSIAVVDAQAAFIKIIQKLRPSRPLPEIGVSLQAQISDNVELGENCQIYPQVTIRPGVRIGKNCRIYPGVYIGEDCVIGDDVTIHANAVFYPDVKLGNRVLIHAAAVLGCDGFGYRFEAGRFIKIPHLGSVRIEDDVEIGAGTTIDRGMIGPTVIGEGTKIDNQVMIAHNCEIGKHNAFASQVGFAGSITTGDYVRCAGQVGVADHVHIGDQATLGARAGVHRDIPPGEVHIGTPAAPEKEQRKIVMSIRKVPEMRKQIRELENQIKQMSQQLESLNQLTADK